MNHPLAGRGLQVALLGSITGWHHLFGLRSGLRTGTGRLVMVTVTCMVTDPPEDSSIEIELKRLPEPVSSCGTPGPDAVGTREHGT